MDKKIFLHIGCGKTGSSALQLWLHKNTKHLARHHITYPTFNQKNIPDYKITSGNGVHIFKDIQENTVQNIIKKLLEKNHTDLLFSSEVFQILTPKQLQTFKKSMEEINIEVIIIAYVRDVYDIAYSSYLQLVKRHLYSDTFFTFCKSHKELQQFSVIEKYETVFDTIHIIHYNSEKDKGLEKSFCRALGLESSNIPAMEKKTINRSITLYETELLKHANAIYKKNSQTNNWKFSHEISNLLIYSHPEAETEILLDERALAFLEKTFQNKITKLNKKYFTPNTLKLFEASHKTITKNIPQIPSEFLLTITAIITFMKTERPSTDLIGMLSSEATKRGHKMPEKALHIMQTAKIIRPEGKIIDAMIEKYKKQVPSQQ